MEQECGRCGNVFPIKKKSRDVVQNWINTLKSDLHFRCPACGFFTKKKGK